MWNYALQPWLLIWITWEDLKILIMPETHPQKFCIYWPGMESGQCDLGNRWGQTDGDSDTLFIGHVIWAIHASSHSLSFLTCKMGRHLNGWHHSPTDQAIQWSVAEPQCLLSHSTPAQVMSLRHFRLHFARGIVNFQELSLQTGYRTPLLWPTRACLGHLWATSGAQRTSRASNPSCGEE